MSSKQSKNDRDDVNKGGKMKKSFLLAAALVGLLGCDSSEKVFVHECPDNSGTNSFANDNKARDAAAKFNLGIDASELLSITAIIHYVDGKVGIAPTRWFEVRPDGSINLDCTGRKKWVVTIKY